MIVKPDAVSDLELDALESQIPVQALIATHIAHCRALAVSPQGVLCVDAGNLVRVFQDGTRQFVGKAKPRRKVKVGELITVRRFERAQEDISPLGYNVGDESPT
ncbi:MAG TPA: hypothetical protein VJS90_09355 [Pseudomonas sp.]|uniref:hypothetical protein n=1 Tax=Pseudomonas sp. TaxID=306 RepID=UPI002B476E27|nr:hypothetical protein [Pseudomonas sp.]HKS13232.1 hypothetical protein [Pseudomonas sp.]